MSADDAGGIYNGSTVTLTVVVKNTGNAAGQWQAALRIPSGYKYVDLAPCGGHFFSPTGGPGGDLIWPDGTDGNGAGDNLAIGATSTCAVRLSVTTSSSNDAATATGYRGPYSNGVVNGTLSYTFITTTTPTTDMAIAMSANKTSVAVGDTVDYTLTASNVGRQTGTSAQTVFDFPTTLSVVPKNCPGASTLGGNSITWNIGNVNYGTSKTCVLTGTAKSGAGTNATVNASISATTTDPNTGNNSARSVVGIVAAPPQADIAAAISASVTSLAPGGGVTFSLNASNAGPQSANSTQLTATFPSQLQLNSASCVTGTLTNSIVWNLGTLAAGASQTCTVQATLNATPLTSITANASISSTTTDNNSGNNSASVTVGVQQQAQAANVAIHLSGLTAGQPYTPGQALHFTVTASNTGGGDANNVVATVHLPNDGSLTGFSSGCGSVNSSGTLLWSIGGLLHNTSLTCTVNALVATAIHPISLSVRIDGANLGSDVDNLMDAVVVSVRAKPKQISNTITGAATTKNSTNMRLSGDGSVAVFQSQETDLVASNVNANGQDIYRVGGDGKAVLETLDSTGHQLIGTAGSPAISHDGGIVAFAFNPSAAKQAKDAIVSSMWAGAAGQPKHQVDTGAGGAAPNGGISGAPSAASAGGAKKLVFCSAASNLVTGDANGARDIFLVDPTNPAQAAQLVSTDASGKQLPGDSCEPQLSADGTKLAFTLSAPTLYNNNAFRQVMRKDLVSGALDLISLSTTPGGPAANGDSSEPSINADGSVIAFTSKASNMDGLGVPVGGMEAFVSLARGGARILKRVRSGDGTVPNGASQHPQLSDDGTVMVMQTGATNFFGSAKTVTTPACGAIMITTNFFSPAAMGSGLCNDQTSNQNPSISGDGAITGFDSNAPQASSSSSNSNSYTLGVSGLGALGASNFGGDFSGQWFDPNQSGQGLVIDVTNPDVNNNRTMILTWFVYLNGQPSWVQGVGTPHAGSGDQAGMVVVSMNPVGISQGKSFPLGEAKATTVPWGSITLTFADAGSGTMSWVSTYSGFNSGTMPITHFLPVSLPAQDAASAQIKSCYSGNWYNPAQSGHGFEFEVIPATPPLLAVDWFAYGPTGAPVWLQGVGPISGNSAQLQLQLINGSGAQFPPKYDATKITPNPWGTATFTFTNSGNASVTWNSTISGYGTGTQPLQPILGPGLLDRRGCQ